MKRKEEKSALCSALFSIQFFFLRFVSWAGEGVQGGASLLCMGGETSNCVEALPGGFTVCLQALAAAAASSLLHFCLAEENTEKNLLSVFFLCLFTPA